MASYQLMIVVKENKVDEFIDSLVDISSEIRDEEGCIDFSLYRDVEKMNAYRVFGEWKTRQVMEKHFKKKSFKVLVGAAKVLGSGFEMSIGETLEKGSYPVARKNQTLSRERQNDVYQVLNRSQTWDLLRAEMNQPRESYKKSTIE